MCDETGYKRKNKFPMNLVGQLAMGDLARSIVLVRNHQAVDSTSIRRHELVFCSLS